MAILYPVVRVMSKVGTGQLSVGHLGRQVPGEGVRALARAHQERGHQVYALRLLGKMAAWQEASLPVCHWR